MHTATFSHPHLQLMAHVAGRQKHSAQRERAERQTVVHMMCRVVNRHMRTLFPDTHRGARKRGSQAHMSNRHMQSDPGRQK